MSMNYSSAMDANVHSQHQQYYTMVAPPPPPTSFQHFHHHQHHHHQQQQQQHQPHHGSGISSPPQPPAAFFQHQHFQAPPTLSHHTTLYELPQSMTGSYQVHTMPLTLVTAPPSTLGPSQPHGAASYMAPPPASFQAAHHHHYAPEAYHHHHHAHFSSSQGLVPQQPQHHHHFGAAASLSNLTLQLNSPTAVLPSVPTHPTAVVRNNDSNSAALLSNPPICEAIPPPSPTMLPTTPPQHPRHDIMPPVETSTRALSFASCRQQRSMKRLEIPPALPGDPEPGPRQLIVNYLALDIGSAELFELFTPYGDVEMARVATDTATGRSIGYGFVFMRRHADAMRAVEHASGRVLLGKRVRVSFAVPQRPVHEATHRHGAVFGAPHLGAEALLRQ